MCIFLIHTVCPRSSDPFYIVTNYIKWVTTSWTCSVFIKISLLYTHVQTKREVHGGCHGILLLVPSINNIVGTRQTLCRDKTVDEEDPDSFFLFEKLLVIVFVVALCQLQEDPNPSYEILLVLVFICGAL